MIIIIYFYNYYYYNLPTLHTPHFLSHARTICRYNLFYVSDIIAKDHVTNFIIYILRNTHQKAIS